jgi:hypothetical protein
MENGKISKHSITQGESSGDRRNSRDYKDWEHGVGKFLKTVKEK